MTEQPPTTEEPATIENVRGHRWLYGANVAITVLVALALVVIVNYLANRIHYRQDLTFSQLYSLSPATTNLLKQLDSRNQKVELVSLASSHEPERAQKVSDLLGEYTRHSSSLQVLEVDNRDDLEARIYQRFEKDAAPYQQVLADYDKLAKDLTQFCEEEATKSNAFVQGGTVKNADDIEQLKSFQLAFAKRFPTLLTDAAAGVKKARNDYSVPRWTTAVAIIRKPVETIEQNLKIFNSAELLERMPPAIAGYLKSRASRYGEILKLVTPFRERLDGLPQLKFDDVVTSLRPGSLVVLTPRDVKVISDTDLFRPQQARSPGAEPTESFTGEQALSSALLSLTMPDKPRVVFVSPAAQQLTTGVYAEFSDRLRKSNFEVLEWASSPSMNPEAGPPPSPEPPALGKGVVWIVVPAEANPQMMMMGMPAPDTRALAAAIERHIAAGGNTLFLAEAAGSMPGMPDAGFPYADLLKPYGVLVKSNLTIVQTQPISEGKSLAIPELHITHYPEHPITEPIESLETFFLGQVTQMGFLGAPTVVTVDPNRPSNATAQIIVETPRSSDVWATARPSLKATFDPKSDDMKSPIPMAVAAQIPMPSGGSTSTAPSTRPATPSRIVVIGNRLFLFPQLIKDDVIGYTSRGDPIMGTRFPGNAELALNSVFWLSGYENMIAVSPRATVALRIRDIDPSLLLWLRVTLIYVGPPIAALVLGAFVYWRRRR